MVGDVVVVGSSIADMVRRITPSGEVRAFDARTGALRWRFDTIARGRQHGADTWEDESWRIHGGANVWSIMSADLARGLVFQPVSTAGANWSGGAFDPKSGRLFVPTNDFAHTTRLRRLPDSNFDDTDGKPMQSLLDGVWWLLRQRGTGLRYAMVREAFEVDDHFCNAPPHGRLTAVDLVRGEIAWQLPVGEEDGVRGLELPAGFHGGAITYRTRPGGRQLLALPPGGHIGLGSHRSGLPIGRLGDRVRTAGGRTELISAAIPPKWGTQLRVGFDTVAARFPGLRRAWGVRALRMPPETREDRGPEASSPESAAFSLVLGARSFTGAGPFAFVPSNRSRSGRLATVVASRERRALQLAERISEAALEPGAWTAVARELSRELGGAAVGILLDFPHREARAVYRAGLRPEISERFAGLQALGEVPWESGHLTHWIGRFGLGSEVFPEDAIQDTLFYREWMEPQGLPPFSPLCHTIAVEDDRWVAVIASFRTALSRPFTDEDLALCNLLVPHLANAFCVSQRLLGVQRQRLALAEVVDRLPTGVILIDAQGQPVVRNRVADEIIAQDDGFRVDADGIHAHDPREDVALQQLVRSGLRPSRGEEPESGGVMAVTRLSGRRAFTVVVSRLLRLPFEPAAPLGAEAVLFVSDPASNPVTTIEVLQSLYNLTRAEAELVQLLAQGCKLEEAAQVRGVTVNTARSQLKQVFSKTDTKRQGELVRLVLTGITSISEK